MQDVYVSVIVPVFNTYPYLEECLDSLMSQTLREIEIICIDNGSTDGSFEFLQAYGKRRDNFTVCRHVEGRQGGARNAGIEIAKGRYIGFVDSDDFVYPEMFQVMYEAAETNIAQVVVCNIQYYHMDTGYGRTALPTRVLQANSPAPIQQRLELLRNLTICNKLFSQKLIEDHKIRFPQGYYHEDQFFVIAALINAERISTIPKSLYFYRKGRQGSVSMYQGPDCKHIFRVMNMVEDYVSHIHGVSQFSEVFSEVKILKLLEGYRLSGPADRRSYFAEMKKHFESVNLGHSYQLLSLSEKREYQIVRNFDCLIYNLYLTLRTQYGELRKQTVQIFTKLLAERR